MFVSLPLLFLLFLPPIVISIFLAKPVRLLLHGHKNNLCSRLRNPHGGGNGSSSRPQLPPGPRGLPVIGNFHQLSPNSLHLSLQRLASTHGPIMSLRIGTIRAVVISSADAARDAFKGTANDLALSSRPKCYATSVIFYGRRDIAFAPYGESWRRARMASVTDLLCQRRVQSFRGVRGEEVAAVLDSIADSSSRGAAIDISELMLRMVNDVTSRVVLGRKFNAPGREGRLRELLLETQALIGGFSLSDCFPYLDWVEALTGWKRRVWRAFNELDKFYNEVIQSHIEEVVKRNTASTTEPDEKNDMVTQLLRLQGDQAHGGAFDCIESIKGILTDMFIAGSDTSTATLVWTMTELIRNPEVLERAQNEVRSSINSKMTIIDETILPKLNYLKLVIKESLRLHPPSPLLVPRETTNTLDIRNYHIPSNTMVIVNVRAIGRDPIYWERPDEFYPERFLFKNKDVDFKGQHFQLLPFGVGRRICPGINFSMASVELMLANMLCWFNWRLPIGTSIEDLDMEEAPGITMHKKTPLLLVASKWIR